MDVLKIFQKRKYDLKLVLDSDFDRYLSSLGLEGDLKSKRLMCKYCGQKVDRTKIFALLPSDNKVSIVCSNKKCVGKIHSDE